MKYADYYFYVEMYLGTIVASEEEFERLLVKASAKVDYYTFGKARHAHDPQRKTAIKMATCAIIDELAKARKTEDVSPALSSETVGSYSRSFRSAAESESALNKSIESALNTYLAHTGLLYRGC